MKYVWALLLLTVVYTVAGDGEMWEDEGREILIRNERGIERTACRYDKGPWSDCDFKANVRSRTLKLKKGDAATCEPTKVVQKKCKPGCRYEKAAWSQCKENGEMTRTDTLKANSDAGCEPNRLMTKKCTARNKQSKGNKEKGSRRNRQ